MRSLQMLGATASVSMVSACSKASTNASTSATGNKVLQILTKEDHQILTAVSDTIIPQGGSFELGAIDIDLALRIDGYLAKNGDSEVVVGLRGALQYLEHHAPKLVDFETPFSALSPADRTTVMQRMCIEDGLSIQVFAALRALTLFYFYTDKNSWPEIAYDGPMIKAVS